MFIEFFGFPASGKSRAAELLNMELRNLQQTTLLYSHGRCIAGEDNLKSCKSLIPINNKPGPQFIEKLNLFFIIFSTIMTGPVDTINKLRFVKRLLVLFTALRKSKDKIIICDEGFVQLYISAQMPQKKSLDLDALKVDLSAIFKLISHVVAISCKKDVINKRLSDRVLDHSRSKKWGVELTSICLNEYDRTIALITRTYSHQVTSVEQENNCPSNIIQDILSAHK